MSSRISNRGNSQTPKDQNDSVEEYDFSGDFDARAEDDGGIISSHEPKSIGQFIKKLIQSARENISNWFQSASDYIKNKFTDSQASRALTNVRQHPALSTRQDIKEKSVTIYENSRAIDFGTSGYPDIQDENFGKTNQGENFGKITSENIQNNEKYLEDFEKFKKIYGEYKNGELDSIDNFKTENAKKYANDLIKNGEENLKNDQNYFFKNVAEYKDLVIASAVLDAKNKFALHKPLKYQQKNFQLWVTSKDPEAFEKLRASETGLSVNLDQAKIYADWVVFQNLIGEFPDSVDQSIIPLATELRDMMESAKAETAIDALRHDATRIADDMMAFFDEPKSDTVVPELKSSAFVSSDPPPPPPPRRLKATNDAAITNAAVLTNIAQSTPPPAPPPRVQKISEEIQQKPNDAVVTLRPVAEPDVERNNLSLSQCVDVFKNLSRSDQTDLGKILAPDMDFSDFRSLVNQSSLFFTDTVNFRPINKDREAYVYKLSDLWDSAKKKPLASNGLSQLRFFRELDYLMNMFKRSN